jgi:GrpB-like predicted nucleotidyltransferase (UPF0157 family)
MSAIQVVDYDPSWPAAFATERDDLLSLLAGLVGDIHHVGSTSIPDLAAKPKIDIDVVLSGAEFIPDAIARIQATEAYTYHGDPYSDGMWTFTRGRGSYGTRLYLCGPGNATHDRRMLFRDWLLTRREDATTYEALKRRLAAEANGDWKFYTGGKSAFVAEIVRQAKAQLISPQRGVGQSAA